ILGRPAGSACHRGGMRRLLAILLTVSGVGVAAAAAAVALWAPHAPGPDLGPGVYVQVATPSGTPSGPSDRPTASRTAGPERPAATRTTHHRADPTLSPSGAQTVPRHSPARAGQQQTSNHTGSGQVDHDSDDD